MKIFSRILEALAAVWVVVVICLGSYSVATTGILTHMAPAGLVSFWITTALIVIGSLWHLVHAIRGR